MAPELRPIRTGPPALRVLCGERVLVTGGCGFIGGAVVEAFRGAGADVVVADRTPYPDPDVDSLVGDLRDPAFLSGVVQPGLTGVVHLAAVTSVLESKGDPAGTYEANVAVTAALLERMRVAGVDRFVLSSTNAVLGDVGTVPLHEDLPPRPLTPYGATKAACEMLASGYAGSYGIAASAVRFTNVYGPRMAAKDSLVPRLMRAALSGQEIDVYGDGTQVRDLVHVDDAVDGVLLAWRRRHVGALTVGSGRTVTVNVLVSLVREITGRPIPTRHVDPPGGEMYAVVADIGRARSLGYEPRVELGDGLRGVWREFSGSAAAALDNA